MLQGAFSYAQKAQDPKAKAVLDKAMRLHCLLYLKDNMGWYLMKELIDLKWADEIEENYQQAVKDLYPDVNTILDAFNPPPKAELLPPIVRDYEKFNS